MALSSHMMLVYSCVLLHAMSGYTCERSKSLSNMVSVWKKDFKQVNPQLTCEFDLSCKWYVLHLWIDTIEVQSDFHTFHDHEYTSLCLGCLLTITAKYSMMSLYQV